jgi:hypothetical protein
LIEPLGTVWATVFACIWSAEEDHRETQISLRGTSREGMGQCMKSGPFISTVMTPEQLCNCQRLKEQPVSCRELTLRCRQLNSTVRSRYRNVSWVTLTEVMLHCAPVIGPTGPARPLAWSEVICGLCHPECGLARDY